MLSINIGESLTNALYLRKLKQKEFAELADTTPTMVSRWTNRKSLRVVTINRICAALDMRPSEFIALGEEG